MTNAYLSDTKRQFLLLFLAICFALAAILESYMILLSVCAIAFISFAITIYNILSHDFRFRFYLLSGLFGGLWLTLGFLISYSQSYDLNETTFRLLCADTLINNSTVDVSSYSLAFSYSLLYILFADFLSGAAFLKKAELKLLAAFQGIQPNSFFARNFKYFTLILSLLVSLYISVSFTGLFQIRSISNESMIETSLPWWHPLLTSLLSLFPPLVSIVIFTKIRKTAWVYLIATTGFLTGLYFALIAGRMFVIIYFAQLATSCLALRIFKQRLKLDLRLIMASIVLIFALYLIGLVFSFVQYIRWYTIDVNPILLVDWFFEFFNNDKGLLDSSIRDNLSSRPLLLWPLAAAISMTDNRPNVDYMYFQDIWNSFLNSIPGPLFLDKSSLMLNENLLYQYFPFADSNIDVADTPFLYAFASFGILGIFIYPLIISLGYYLSISIVVQISSLLSGFLRSFCLFFSISIFIAFSTVSCSEIQLTTIFRYLEIPVVFTLLFLPFIILKGLNRNVQLKH
jgi:hypothetical protein